ncbi:hypothetical protein [Nostoc sp. WHI]|uniref:hypothetical protein n=1 Tax=Nostoc sp. WHI TaxID=2650611 RepID=UPI0018C5A533|nr:hypothetical protein [Nostoc sp. WHI]
MVTIPGQHYPDLKQLKLTVVDFGVGIPQNVRDFHKNTNLPVARDDYFKLKDNRGRYFR